jgi:hypothetical protein
MTLREFAESTPGAILIAVLFLTGIAALNLYLKTRGW